MNPVFLLHSLMNLTISLLIVLAIIYFIDHANLYSVLSRYSGLILTSLIVATLSLIPIFSFSVKGALFSQEVFLSFSQKVITSVLVIIAIFSLVRLLGSKQIQSKILLSNNEAKMNEISPKESLLNEPIAYLTLSKEDIAPIASFYNEKSFIDCADNEQFASVSELLLLSLDEKPVPIESLTHVLEITTSMDFCPPETGFELFMTLYKHDLPVKTHAFEAIRDRVITIISKNFSKIENVSIDNIISGLGKCDIFFNKKGNPGLGAEEELTEEAYERGRNNSFIFFDRLTRKSYDIDAGEYLLSWENDQASLLNNLSPKGTERPENRIGDEAAKPAVRVKRTPLYDPTAKINYGGLFGAV